MILTTQDLCPHNELFETPPLSIYLESTIFRPNSHFLPQVSLSRSPTCPRSRLYGALTEQLLWSSVDYLAAALATCDVLDILPIGHHVIHHSSLAVLAWYVQKWIINHFRSLHLQVSRKIFRFPRDMIHSLFTVNGSGDVFLEKHWKSVISRSIVDYFFDAQVFVRSFNNILERWIFVFAEQGNQPNRHPPGHCNAPSLSYLNIQVQRASWKYIGDWKLCWFMKLEQNLGNLTQITVSCSQGVTSSLWRCVWRRFLRSSSSSSFTELLTRWRTISLSAPRQSSRTTMLLYTRLSSDSFLKIFYDCFKVLDEMLDNGFPLATEANILKELIKPPNMLRDVVNSGWLQIHH